MAPISLHSVSKVFELEENRPRSLQELALGWMRGERRKTRQNLWALQDVSFDIGRGEAVGLIGTNGSGKSTCLKLMTRILWPSSGTVTVDGRVAALLELGAGFHPELTGRENIMLNGSVLGISRRDMMSRFEDIVAFAELERFIDVPIKVYSSGMYVRLAFATAISVDADILLVDEVLAVGDQPFQEKCLSRIRELKESGVTIVLVSHDLDSVAKLCDRVIWLDGGRQAMDGQSADVINSYLAYVQLDDEQEQAKGAPSASSVLEGCEPKAPQEAVSPGMDVDVGILEDADEMNLEEAEAAAARSLEQTAAPPVAERWGTERVVLSGVELLAADGSPTDVLCTDQPAEVAIHYVAAERVGDVAFGVAFHKADGTLIGGCNTILSGFDVEEVDGEGVIRYQIERLPLLPGSYYLSVAAHDTKETEAYDYHSFGYRFDVEARDACAHQGLAHFPAQWRHDRMGREVTSGS